MRHDVVPIVVLDERRERKDGSFPVKLRVTFNRIAKYYPTQVAVTPAEFELLKAGKHLSKEAKDKLVKINASLGKATDVCKSLNAFSFQAFERRFNSKSYGSNDVYKVYLDIIDRFRREERYATSEIYQLSLRTLKAFTATKSSRASLSFLDVTPRFVQEFEDYILARGCTVNTVGIYIRCLRAAFNTQIADGELDREYYPFGRNKYQMPSNTKKKKALDKTMLETLLNATPENYYQEKARDFWFFSYNCNGINITDIARLKFKNIDDETITFIRRKTRITSKAQTPEIVAYRNEYINWFINKYASRCKEPDTYVFSLIDDNMDEEIKRTHIKKFTRFVNQHLKLLAEKVGLRGDISSVWARHSFSTTVVRNGGSLEYVQESLGHQNIKTTMNYWAGFDSEFKKKMSDSLMNFTKQAS